MSTTAAAMRAPISRVSASYSQIRNLRTFHWAAKTDDGLHVVDVWESREVFDKFAQEQIGPYTQEAGIPAPPETTYYEVHNTLEKSA